MSSPRVLRVILLVFVCAVIPSHCQWRRKLDNELFFYNSIEGAVENGWTDAKSLFTEQQYNVNVATAEAVARVTLLANGAEWRLTAHKGENMHQANKGDRVRCRLRLECPFGDKDCAQQTPRPSRQVELAVYNDFNQKIVTSELELVPSWRVETLTLPENTNIQSIMIRSHDFVPVTFYVGYCYVQKY